MKEHVLSTNAFGMPKVFDSSDAEYVLITRLLLLEPGKFQSHPNMGVGLRSRYRYNNDENFLPSLSSDIRNQISTYIPSISMTNVSLTLENNTLGIIIDTVSGSSYVVGYNGNTEEMSIAATYLLKDL